MLPVLRVLEALLNVVDQFHGKDAKGDDRLFLDLDLGFGPFNSGIETIDQHLADLVSSLAGLGQRDVNGRSQSKLDSLAVQRSNEEPRSAGLLNPEIEATTVRVDVGLFECGHLRGRKLVTRARGHDFC